MRADRSCSRLGTHSDRRFVGSHIGWLEEDSSCQSWNYNSALSASSRANASLPGRVTGPTSLSPYPLCPVTSSTLWKSRAFDVASFSPNTLFSRLVCHISSSRCSSLLFDERSSRRLFYSSWIANSRFNASRISTRFLYDESVWLRAMSNLIKIKKYKHDVSLIYF